MASGILLLSLIVVIPPSNATVACTGGNGSDDFEGDQTFFRPGYPGTGTCFYKFPATNTGYVVSTPVSTGTRAFYTGAGVPQFDLLHGNVCTTADRSPNVLVVSASFDFMTPTAAPAAGDYYGIGIGAGASGSGNFGGIGWTSTLIPQVWIANANGFGQNNIHTVMPGAPAMAGDTWYRAIVTIDCLGVGNGATVTARITISATQYGVTASTGTGGFPTGGISGNFHYRFLDENGAGSPQPTGASAYLDDIAVSGFGGGARPSFCPNALEVPDYGYTYRRGADFYQDGSPIGSGLGLSSGFNYQAAAGGESGWDYSAKQLTSGTQAAHTNITIEAGTEGGTSTFRTSFNTLTGATPDATTKGNGLDTQNFANHAEAQFVENGNTWQLSMWYVTSGGTRTQLGSALNYGNANDATDFVIWVDDQSGANGALDHDFTFGATGGNTVTGPYIAITTLNPDPGSDNLILGYRNLPAAFTGDLIFDVWYIGSAGAISAAATGLDENQQVGSNTGDEGGHDSTCIFDDTGTAVFGGSQGVTPGNDVPPNNPTSSTGSFLGIDPGNLDPSGNGDPVSGGFFMSMLLIIGFAAVGAGIIPGEKPSTMIWGAGVGAALGFAWTIFLGVMPPIIVFVLIVVGVGIMGTRFFVQSRSSGGG